MEPSGAGTKCSQARWSWVTSSGSLKRCFTSSCRVTNQKPSGATKWTGSSSRSRCRIGAESWAVTRSKKGSGCSGLAASAERVDSVASPMALPPAGET
jgi:hypothetical protein